MLQDLINNVAKLREQLNNAEKELREYNDGYIYKITSCRYHCYRVRTFHNAWVAEEFIQNSYDGENYIVEGVFSNNPNFKNIIYDFREHKCWSEIRMHEKIRIHEKRRRRH